MQKYQLDQPLNPSRLSAIDISKKFWTQPELKSLLILCIKEDKRCSTSKSTESQNELRAQLSLKIDESNAPGPVKKELGLIVDLVARDLWEFIQKKRKKHWEKSSVDLSLYIDHIRWTTDGCIDSSASIKSMYLSKILPENSSTWEELCDHCLEDCLKDLWPKVSEIEKKKSTDARSVMSLYWCYRMQNRLNEELETLKKAFRAYSKNFSLEENMLLEGFSSDNPSAVEYFWELLSDEQKKKLIIPACGRFTSMYPSSVPQPILLRFLLKQLSLYDLHESWVRLLGSSLVLMKLLKWPCQDLFLLAVEESSEHGKRLDYIKIMMEIVKAIDGSFLNADGADGYYRNVFHEVWEKIMCDDKGSGNFMIILTAIAGIKDIGLLNHVINDRRLRDCRETHVSLMQKHFMGMMNPLKDVFFEGFMTKVLKSQNERKRFKRKIVKNEARRQTMDYDD